jgi:hypothetical protein
VPLLHLRLADHPPQNFVPCFPDHCPRWRHFVKVNPYNSVSQRGADQCKLVELGTSYGLVRA